MDRVSSLANRLNMNLLSVTKRSPPASSGQSHSTLTSGGNAPVTLSSRFETGGVTSGTTAKLHELFLVPDSSEVGASGKSFCFTCIGYNGMFCVRVDCDKNHRGPGAYKARAGDIHIISKQGEAFVQPKINTRDIC